MQPEGYLVGPDTKQEIENVLLEKPGNNQSKPGRGGPVRQVCSVRVVTWDDTTKRGTCVVEELNGNTLAWESFGTASQTILKSANDETLTVGKRYPALRYGNYGGTYTTMGTAVFCAYTFPFSASSSASSGSGNGVCILDDVWCQGGGVYGNEVRLTGYVSIGGVQFPVTFSTASGGCGGGSTSGG